MKRLLYLFVLLNALVLRAQTDSLTVHVEGRPLTDLLTDEQKQNVNYLFITGTLADEDYAFLRGNNLPKLHELNLRKADIDTIPKKAFYGWDFYYDYRINKKNFFGEGNIVLPAQLKYVGERALCNSIITLTGAFPKTDFDVFRWTSLVVSDDNPHCKAVGNEWERFSILSMDGKKLYFCAKDEIPEGVEIIEEKAFEGHEFMMPLNFPKTIKEIKDYVFYNCTLAACDGNHEFYAEFIFQTETPPILGKEVFGINRKEYVHNFFNDAILTVPEGCYENYINADEQWKIFKKDRGETSIESPTSGDLHIKKTSMGWELSSEVPINEVYEYDQQGILIKKEHSINTKNYVIRHQNPSIKIITIKLMNEKEQTVKLAN